MGAATVGGANTDQQNKNEGGSSRGKKGTNASHHDAPSSTPPLHPNTKAAPHNNEAQQQQQSHQKKPSQEAQPHVHVEAQMPPSSNLVISGHHLYGGNPKALLRGARYSLSNHAVLRLNDCGTLTRLLDNAQLFRHCYPGASIGLSGETLEGDGASLAHVAVGMQVRHLKVGGVNAASHMAVLNELVTISEYLQRNGLVMQRAPVYDTRLMAMPPCPPEVVLEAVVEKPAGGVGRRRK